MSLFTSLLTAGSNSHQETSENANALATDFVTAGVAGTISLSNGVTTGTGSFAVNAQGSPNMTVAVSSGTAWVFATPSSQNSQALRVKNTTTANVTIAANASGSTRWDFVYISLDASKAANPASDASDVATLVTSRSSSSTTDNGTPPTYGYLLAVVTVANGASSITQGNIVDKRSNAILSSAGFSQSTSWNSLGLAPNTVAANGNRSYSLTFNSTDLTGTLSAGMRLRTTRTVAAPTQCTSLNGSTQYYSKTSPAGMTFTNNFVVSAWVKLTQYGAYSMIASRYNGTSGWDFNINASGQLTLNGYNGGVANFSNVIAYQSLPLNKWVHVAAQLDMSTFTATTTTSYIMIDGVDVPTSVTRGGTNPTALIQAGNLEIGGRNGGLLPWPGKIAQVAIYNAKVTEATILASINQGLAGTETSLISAYSFNNSINDLNANANNLTANGSAVATNADSPFGGQAGGTISSTLDYGIVQSVSFSTNTTVVVQVPEGCAIPTSGGVSAVVYSSNTAPYGFPKQRGKWVVEMLLLASSNLVTTSGTWSSGTTNGSYAITMPIGEWYGGYSAYHYSDQVATAIHINATTFSTSNNSETDTLWSSAVKNGLGSGSTFNGATVTIQRPLSVSAQTTYYLLGKNSTNTGTAATHDFNNNEGYTRVAFENANL